MFGLFIIAALIGLIPATIAKNKGHSFATWWVFGALLFIVALPAALMLRPDPRGLAAERMLAGEVKCPYCAEFIKREAVVCRWCGRDLPGRPAAIDGGHAGKDEVIAEAREFVARKEPIGPAIEYLRSMADRDTLTAAATETQSTVNRALASGDNAKVWRLLNAASKR